jgi:hypothetical protein
LATSRVFALLCVAAQGAGVPRWSRTMATASRWVSPEPAENTRSNWLSPSLWWARACAVPELAQGSDLGL